jgi:hypothetical protein
MKYRDLCMKGGAFLFYVFLLAKEFLIVTAYAIIFLLCLIMLE